MDGSGVTCTSTTPQFSYGDGGRAWAMLCQAPQEIHFIGASVTAQRDSWADRLVKLASERTGHAHRMTKNAMGGVGLLFGLANHQPIADSVEPRLVFVEFSTGDLNLGLTPLNHLESWLEHLLTRLRLERARVMFVHNWRSDFASEDVPGIRRTYDRVAARHAVPVLANHRHAAALIDTGVARREALFRDVCHTTPEGALAYARHALDCLQAMAVAPVACREVVPTTAPDDPPIDFFELPSATFDGTPVASSTYTYPSTLQLFPVRTMESGLAIEFEASGLLLGVSFLSGPRTGWVGLSIDGKEARRFRCFDRNSFYERYILLPSVFQLARSTLRLYDDGTEVDFSMAAQLHPDFALPRLMKLVQFVGAGLEVHAARVVRHEATGGDR